ncbi:MAG: hypothetical protein FIA97_19110 [Methylococcaceae bacterium]|nr:hypothetical protein [Methylococcaceae bacterium]
MSSKTTLTQIALIVATSWLAGAAQADPYWGYAPQPYGWYQPAPVYVAPPPPVYAAPVYPAPVYVPPPVQPGLTVGLPPFYLNLPLGGGWEPRHHHHHGRHWDRW